MPGKTFFIIKDIPLHPVISTVTGIAAGTVERCDLQIELIQCLNIANKNNIADALKILSIDMEGKTAHKAVSDKFTVIVMPKETYAPRFIVASDASKAVLDNGS